MIATIPIAPAGNGRHISADTVAANNDSRPQAGALKPECGTSQIAMPTAGGTAHRHRSGGAVAPGGWSRRTWGDGTEGEPDDDEDTRDQQAPQQAEGDDLDIGAGRHVGQRPAVGDPTEDAVTLHSLLAARHPPLGAGRPV